MAQLLKAAGNGNLEKVTELRDQWNYQNKKGETALHIAVSEDQLEIVSYLVSHGAPLDFQDKKNQFTPLMLCLAQRPPRHLEIFQAILKGKPDLAIKDSTGQSILHLATQYEEVEAVEMLLRAKPKVDAIDAKKMTALHVAAGKNNLELVKLLVERGHASVNAADAKGNTPLHWACISNTEDLLPVLQYLISKGARPSKNAAGNSPLHTEGMHCDSGAKWPTEAAEVLTKAFPQLESEVNNNGLTAQQTFEQAVDSEDAPVADASPATGPQKRSKASTEEKSEEQYQETASAARAAAIARTKKKGTKTAQEKSGQLVNGIIIVSAIVVMLIMIYMTVSELLEEDW